MKINRKLDTGMHSLPVTRQSYSILNSNLEDVLPSLSCWGSMRVIKQCPMIVTAVEPRLTEGAAVILLVRVPAVQARSWPPG
jgi:hypothetical protein